MYFIILILVFVQCVVSTNIEFDLIINKIKHKYCDYASMNGISKLCLTNHSRTFTNSKTFANDELKLVTQIGLGYDITTGQIMLPFLNMNYSNTGKKLYWS